MLTREQAQKLTEKILSYSKFPECSVQVSESEQAFLRFANNGVTTSGFVVERNIAISSTKDARTGSTTTTDVDDNALKAAVARTEELALISPPNQEHVEPLGRQQYPGLENFDPGTASARSTQMVPHVRAIIQMAVKNKLVSAGFIQRSADTIATANKAGNFGFHRYADSHLSTTVRAADGSSSGWASQPAVRFADINGEEVGRVAVSKCMAWTKPRRLDPGAYTVVLEPTAVSDLGRMMIFSFMARQAEEGRSFLSKKGGGTMLGDKMFPEFINLRSDPFDKRMPALPWSSGGIPNARMDWIEKGVVKNLIYDRYWARKTGKAPTPFPSSMILQGTDTPLAALIASVDKGLLVTRFWYIRPVNPQTGQATGLTRDGLFLIEKGKVSSPVVNFRFNESPVRMLQNTVRLGREVRTRGGEGGGMITPSLLANEFHFTSISDAV